MEPKVHWRAIGPQDMQPHELIRDVGDEYPNLQSAPPLSALPAPLQDGNPLPWRHLQNVRSARLPLGLSCDDVWPDNGQRCPGVYSHMAWLLHPAIRLPSVHLANTLSVKWGGWGRWRTLELWSTFSCGLCLQSLSNGPGFPHHQHASRPSSKVQVV
jgi:hypothetical protein